MVTVDASTQSEPVTIVEDDEDEEDSGEENASSGCITC